MSKDKHRTIFSGQMEAFVFIILDMFFARCTVFKIGEYHQFYLENIRSCDVFRSIVHNIWWIILIVFNWYWLSVYWLTIPGINQSEHLLCGLQTQTQFKQHWFVFKWRLQIKSATKVFILRRCKTYKCFNCLQLLRSTVSLIVHHSHHLFGKVEKLI